MVERVELRETFAEAFWAALERTANTRFDHTQEIQTLLLHLFENARAAWPRVQVDPPTFAGYLAARLPNGVGPRESLSRLHHRDLYLCCACAAGLNVAQLQLEEILTTRIATVLRRLDFSPGVVEDALQRLREDMLIARGGRPPGITKYSGTGRLESWLRLCAVRLARREFRKARDYASFGSDADLVSVFAPSQDPELLLLERSNRETVTATFNEVIVELSVEERALLRHRFLDALTVQEMARLYGVHHSTICRHLEAICRGVLAATRERLRKRLNVGDDTLSSILRAFSSRLELQVLA